MLGGFRQDLRFAFRIMRKNPGFTLIAVLMLALGIGANTAIFSVVDALLLKELPVSRPGQLVLFRWLGGQGVVRGFNGVMEKDEATGLQTSTSISYPAFERLRDQNQTLASVFAFASLERLNLRANGQAEMVHWQAVSGSYFTDLGVSALLGRVLTNDDDKVSTEPAAVISYRYWQRRFNSDPAVIGKVVYLSGTAFTIVGVTRRGFFGTFDVGSAPNITVPIALFAQVSPGNAERQHSASNWWLHIMGRLKPGVSAAQAQAELTAILQRHVLELPAASEQRTAPQIRLDSGSQGLMYARGVFSSQLAILMAIVGLVLLIACINLANLLLARGATRQKELALRASVGASRIRLIQQLLTEGLLLAVLGGALGLLFADWGKDVLLALLTANWNEFAVDLRLDWRVLGFTAVVSMLTGILFGLVPALRATRIDLTPMLKENPGSSGPVQSRLSKALVVAQVAMSLLLLAGAGQFVRTLHNLNQIDAGFDRENLLIFSVHPGSSGYETARLANLYRQITEHIAALPGVRAVSSSRAPLVAGDHSTPRVEVPGYTPRAGENMSVGLASVAPEFLATMGIHLLSGRESTPQDIQETPKVAVVSQALAQRFFPNQNPLGRRLKILEMREVQIIGVARDAKYGDLRGAIRPVVYIPYLQNQPGPPEEMSFTVRTESDPSTVIAAIRQAVQSIDRNLPISNIGTQNEMIARMLAKERLFAVLSSFFGLLALALVCIGLYGVMSYTVARRTHEIGVRMALGAQSAEILRMVLGESMLLVSTGSLIGLAAAFATMRWIAGMLYVSIATDPLTIAMVTLLLLAVAAVSGWLPARRATRVDPLVALRQE